MKGTNLGEFEELVLLVVGVLHPDAYGVAIKKELERKTDRKVSIGAVHAATNRLEHKGFLESYKGALVRERGGKRKKCYKVTFYGQQTLKSVMEMRMQLWQAIPNTAFSVKINLS